MALINIHNFIEEERPYFEQVDAIVSMDSEHSIDPGKEYSTELGEVPQADQKGSVSPSYIRDPYAYNYMYTI